jgi:hypothetical protein
MTHSLSSHPNLQVYNQIETQNYNSHGPQGSSHISKRGQLMANSANFQ